MHPVKFYYVLLFIITIRDIFMLVNHLLYFCSVLSAECVKEIKPKPGDRFLAFVTSVWFLVANWCYQQFIDLICVYCFVSVNNNNNNSS